MLVFFFFFPEFGQTQETVIESGIFTQWSGLRFSLGVINAKVAPDGQHCSDRLY